jgi:Cu(I)/Ag(I) efflux system membrane fusion protein
VLFDLVDLTSVWALFDAYEVDLPHLKTGDKVDFTLQALPGKTFSGKISFIDPMLDRTTRTAKVRVETSNPKLELKPEMYANAVINASVSGFAEAVVIPKTAILWTGKRSIVYVRQQGVGSPTFMLREIETGADLGDAYIVLSGLNEGEEIATGGVFSIDASAQLEGKRSMMNDSRVSPSENSAGQTAQHAVFTVQGLCDMCKTRIETVAKQVAGVSSASWDMPTRQLHLHFDSAKTSVDAVGKAIAAAGHDTDRDKAAEAVYNALPDCCKYRK